MAESLDIEAVVRACGSRLGYMAMKAKQIEAITAFVNGKDTFIVLPTGYGKSLVYAVLPLVFDSLRGTELMILSICMKGSLGRCCVCAIDIYVSILLYG